MFAARLQSIFSTNLQSPTTAGKEDKWMCAGTYRRFMKSDRLSKAPRAPTPSTTSHTPHTTHEKFSPLSVALSIVCPWGCFAST